ncbi:MAG: GNAT family N-acetyltransferase [Planctomycetes bacterium]|nr:GNAT family N-acetyltransferase [Planctomycetota bacterium]
MIRLATREDVDEIARLIALQGFEIDGANVTAIWDAWQAEGNFSLVIPGKNSLLGVVTLHKMTVLHRPKPVGRITLLGVDPIAQGQGYGRALVEAAENILHHGGCEIIEVTSHERRQDAHDFYRHFGFKQTSFRFAR